LKESDATPTPARSTHIVDMMKKRNHKKEKQNNSPNPSKLVGIVGRILIEQSQAFWIPL
jgi:hypothetical protein